MLSLVSTSLSRLALSNAGNRLSTTALTSTICGQRQKRPLHTSCGLRDLMEFFDDPKHWGADKVRVGRHWKKDELRLKSNEDLHKLWFVLLKERNMLLTTQHAYRAQTAGMPNEERLDKVDISMENLEEVVRERNRAYNLLETGESGEAERSIVQNFLGIDEGYVQREHALPYWRNDDRRAMLRNRYRAGFLQRSKLMYRLYREKTWRDQQRKKLFQLMKAAKTLARFPDTSPEALEEEFPEVTYGEVTRYDRAKGHCRNDHIDAPSGPPTARFPGLMPKGQNY